MVDVDHFKLVNDEHGHAAGDEVLKTLSAALLEGVRETDFVGRYGGEEFCLLLPRTSLQGGGGHRRETAAAASPRPASAGR